MALKPYHELPVNVRRSRKNLYEYIRTELSGGVDSSDNTVSPTPATRTITFTINDGTDPIEGASVVIDEVTKTTGSAGGCSFNDIVDGSVSVTVIADGYNSKTETITVSADDTSFTISLTAA